MNHRVIQKSGVASLLPFAGCPCRSGVGRFSPFPASSIIDIREAANGMLPD
jgi:hypothetical protein